MTAGDAVPGTWSPPAARRVPPGLGGTRSPQNSRRLLNRRLSSPRKASLMWGVRRGSGAAGGAGSRAGDQGIRARARGVRGEASPRRRAGRSSAGARGQVTLWGARPADAARRGRRRHPRQLAGSPARSTGGARAAEETVFRLRGCPRAGRCGPPERSARRRAAPPAGPLSCGPAAAILRRSGGAAEAACAQRGQGGLGGCAPLASTRGGEPAAGAPRDVDSSVRTRPIGATASEAPPISARYPAGGPRRSASAAALSCAACGGGEGQRPARGAFEGGTTEMCAGRDAPDGEGYAGTQPLCGAKRPACPALSRAGRRPTQAAQCPPAILRACAAVGTVELRGCLSDR